METKNKENNAKETAAAAKLTADAAKLKKELLQAIGKTMREHHTQNLETDISALCSIFLIVLDVFGNQLTGGNGKKFVKDVIKQISKQIQ